MLLQSTFEKILALLARATIKKYNPIIIGVTGSVGKTSAKEAIYCVVASRYQTWKSEKSFNTEIGLPLTILGARNCHRNILLWGIELGKALFRLITSMAYPQVLVLEFGVQKPGDMDYLLSIARPHIAVVTAIGEIPVHVEFFNDPEEVINEKEKIITTLPSDSYAVLNHDDDIVLGMKEKTKAHPLTFGFEAHAGIRMDEYTIATKQDTIVGEVPSGINFFVTYRNQKKLVSLRGAFGLPHVYAASAAVAVGAIMQLSLDEIIRALSGYVPLPGRMRLLSGIKHSFILDDTYNAAPAAMRSALDTLHALPAKRKIAVLGDMLEIGKYTEAVHKSTGTHAARIADLIVTVGSRAKFIAREATFYMLEQSTDSAQEKRVYAFDNGEEAGKALDRLVKPGDLILVKGSRSMHMEKIVEEIMAQPEYADQLLVG